MTLDLATARLSFEEQFGRPPTLLTHAPGRVNIIGEHTDYNHGFVLPMALEQGVLLLARPRQDDLVEAYSDFFQARAQASLSHPKHQPASPWLDYVLGVAAMLHARGLPARQGVDLYITNDLPVGAGVSSSAALEMAALCLFEALGTFHLDGPAAAQLGQEVENEFMGLHTGIMDQFASRCCRKGHALFLDCRTLESELVPVKLGGYTFVIADTTSPRKLTTSKYNERVQECTRAVAALQAQTGKLGTHLRDFTLPDLESAAPRLDPLILSRARHVLTENERTVSACAAMRAGDAATLGRLLNASDDSLRVDYEVTSPELEAMTGIGRALPGCLGARMTGAGFGGCTIHLVETARADVFGETLLTQYQTDTGLHGHILKSAPGDGARVIEHELQH